jgi:hypothetical protein
MNEVRHFKVANMFTEQGKKGTVFQLERKKVLKNEENKEMKVNMAYFINIIVLQCITFLTVKTNNRLVNHLSPYSSTGTFIDFQKCD